MNVWLLYYGLHVRAECQVVNDLIVIDCADLQVFSDLTTIKSDCYGLGVGAAAHLINTLQY
jgi:hypothetical protein